MGIKENWGELKRQEKAGVLGGGEMTSVAGRDQVRKY